MKFTKLSLGLCIALSLAACSSNYKDQQEEAATDSTSIQPEMPTELSGTDAKLVKTADIDLQVGDVYKSTNNIRQNVKKFGGLVMQNEIKTVQSDSKTVPKSNDSVLVISSYTVNAEMTVKVPSDNLDDFMQSVAADATIIYNAQLSIDDQSINYLGSKLKQQSRQKILDRELKKDTLKTNDLLELARQQETVIDQKMQNLRTDANVRFSTLSLHLTQSPLIRKETLANNNLNTYQAPAFKRLGDAFSAGLNIMFDLVISVLYIWPFIIIGLGAWATYRYLKPRMKVKV